MNKISEEDWINFQQRMNQLVDDGYFDARPDKDGSLEYSPTKKFEDNRSELKEKMSKYHSELDTEGLDWFSGFFYALELLGLAKKHRDATEKNRGATTKHGWKTSKTLPRLTQSKE